MELNDKNKRLLHDNIRKSIREHLIRGDMWFEHVKRLETGGPLRFELAGDVNSLQYMWMVDYPYDVPLYKLLFGRDFNPNTPIVQMTSDQLMAWSRAISMRTTPFINYALSEDDLVWLDDNYIYGAILHKTTGVIIPFDYTRVNNIQFVYMPAMYEHNAVASVMYMASIDPEHAEEMRDTLTKSFHLWWMFDYVDGETDGFTNKNFSASISAKVPLLTDEVTAIMSYATNAFKLHSKVITLI